MFMAIVSLHIDINIIERFNQKKIFFNVTIENRFEFLITEGWLAQRKHLRRHLVFSQLVLCRLIIRHLSLL